MKLGYTHAKEPGNRKKIIKGQPTRRIGESFTRMQKESRTFEGSYKTTYV